MAIGPTATTRAEKWDTAQAIAKKLQTTFGEAILAIGFYGSLARGTDGPFSDIEMWTVVEDGRNISGFEFIWGAFKVEIDVVERTGFNGYVPCEVEISGLLVQTALVGNFGQGWKGRPMLPGCACLAG